MNISSLLTLNNSDINHSIQQLFFKVIEHKDYNITDEIKLDILSKLNLSYLTHSTTMFSQKTNFIQQLQELSLKYPYHTSIETINTNIQNFLSEKHTFSSSTVLSKNILIFNETLTGFNYFSQYFQSYQEILSVVCSRFLENNNISKPHDIIQAEKMLEVVKQLNQKNCSVDPLENFWIAHGSSYYPEPIEKEHFSSFTSDFDLSIFLYHYLNSLRAATANYLFQHFYYHPEQQSSFKHFPHFFQFCDWMNQSDLHYIHLLYEEEHLNYLHALKNVDGYHYYVNHFFGVIPEPSFNHLIYLEKLIKKQIDYDILLRNVPISTSQPLQKSFYSYLKYSYDDLNKLFVENNSYLEEDEEWSHLNQFFNRDDDINIAFTTLKNIVDEWSKLHLNFDLKASLTINDEIPKSKI